MAVGLLFSGQGAQRVGMGRSLYDNAASARALYDEANAVLGYDFKKICFEGPEEELTQTRVCQPALYVLGFAAAKILAENEKLNDCGCALGLSLGELTALAAAGVFDFATGLRLVAARAELMQKACESTRGGMAALIGGDRAAAEALAKECDIDLANLNCPGQIVVSGEADKVTKAAGLAKERGFKMAVPLKVAGAYHSRLMAGASAAYAEVLKDVDFKAPRFPVFTNVTGLEIRAPDEIKAALVKQIVSPVLWEDCQRAALSYGITQYYECGPGAVLAGFAKRIDKALVITPACEWADFAQGA
ncbi:MAG TPA: ACP S-malonyltransferase [Opitutales bacterium]|nr:ACP S-malonyltransferase [Opitutales bacterium]